jgi:hypothetical protein
MLTKEEFHEIAAELCGQKLLQHNSEVYVSLTKAVSTLAAFSNPSPVVSLDITSHTFSFEWPDAEAT